MKKFIYLILFTLVCTMPLSLVSCNESDEESTEFDNWEERNDVYFQSVYTKAQQAIANGDKNWKIIRAYSKVSSTTNVTDHIVVEVLNEGTGETSPLFTDSVSIHYRGNLMPSASYTDGYQFDTTWTGDYNLNTMKSTKGVVSGYITGFSSAIQNMHDGDRWRVYIPQTLGYGSNAQTTIPAYSTLVFDLTLVKSWKSRKTY